MIGISKKELRKVLPFKAPFLLIDEVISYEPGEKIVAEKYLTGKEWFLKGHFPKNPIMPGHMIAESMAQACSLLFAKSGYEEIKDKLFLLTSSKASFFNVVRPGDKLIITAYPVKVISTACIVKAEAHVKDRLVARGEFSVAVKIPKGGLSGVKKSGQAKSSLRSDICF